MREVAPNRAVRLAQPALLALVFATGAQVEFGTPPAGGAIVHGPVNVFILSPNLHFTDGFMKPSGITYADINGGRQFIAS